MLDFLIRLRTYIVGALGIVIVLLPDLLPVLAELLNAPQIVAVLPEGWRTWAAVFALLCTVWTRWRPATRAADPEVQVAQAIKRVDGPATVVIRSATEAEAVIDA